MAAKLQRTRFVCISDTHNASPVNGAFKLPKGDVLVHAGDLTNQGTLSELRRAVEWIEGADFKAKVVIAGNHDITLDEEFYSQQGSYFHNQFPQSSEDCTRLLRDSQSITYLNHESATIHLDQGTESETTFRVFGSPYSPAHGRWAFGYSGKEAQKLWDQVPLDSDIVVTHTPPKYHCDESRDRGAAGCEVLRQTLWRVRPRLLICGHVHEGRGLERVRWDLMAPNIKYKEESTSYWVDPSQGKKQGVADLSSMGGEPLDNDGGGGKDALEVCPEPVASEDRTSRDESPRRRSKAQSLFRLKHRDSRLAASSRGPGSVVASTVCSTGVECDDRNLSVVPAGPSTNFPELPSATRGQGGMPPSGRCDLEALSQRMGRKETCIINAAVMASSWPHKGVNGRKYNKPIVVDIDLPIGSNNEH